MFSIVGFQVALDSHNSVGPILSDEVYDYLTCFFCPMVEASTQALDFPPEVVSANSKSQDQWRCQAAIRQTQTSLSVIILDIV